MRGYTLIEVVVVIVIIGIIVGIGVPMLLGTVDAMSFASAYQDRAVYTAIVAMSRMSREIRRLDSDTSVTTATASQLTFTDVDGAAITFNRSGNTLMRNADALADNVTALTFTYYDDNAAVIATPIVNPNDTDIRRINIAFSVLAGANTLNFQFQTRPQNLKRVNEKLE